MSSGFSSQVANWPLHACGRTLALLQFGFSDAVWPVLRHQTDPRTATYVIHNASQFGVDPHVFSDRLPIESDVTVQRAILLALGGFPSEQMPEDLQHHCAAMAREFFSTHPDPGLHSACEWLLHNWKGDDVLALLRQKVSKDREAGRPQEWFFTSRGHTMIVIRGGVFLMGSPTTEVSNDDDETQHLRRVPRTFAMAATEVKHEQYQGFLEDTHKLVISLQEPNVHSDAAAGSVSWYRAAEYCNWLSRIEGIPEEQWVYVPNTEGEFAEGMRIKDGHLQLSGYRLPTDAEWEFACRGGTVTRRYYGDSDALLDRYGWYAANSQRRPMPVGSLIPNRFGLFDMHGNVFEWCGDRYRRYPADSPNTPIDDIVAGQIVLDNEPRPLRSYSFVVDSMNVRSANRLAFLPSNDSHYIGFRPARTVSATNADNESQD